MHRFVPLVDRRRSTQTKESHLEAPQVVFDIAVVTDRAYTNSHSPAARRYVQSSEPALSRWPVALRAQHAQAHHAGRYEDQDFHGKSV